MSSQFVTSDRSSDLGTFATPPAARAPEAPPIDLSSLLRRCLDDTTFCGMILHKFAARCGDQLAALQRALDANNTPELVRQAHTLQGVAANLSAARLRQMADQLERVARAGDLSAARRHLAETASEVHRCRNLVPELIAKITR